MASTSCLVNLMAQSIISSLVIEPSLSTSIFLNNSLTSSMAGYFPLSFATASEAAGYMMAMNSPMSSRPSPSTSISLKRLFTSSMLLMSILILLRVTEAAGVINSTNSSISISPSPSLSPRFMMASTSMSVYERPVENIILFNSSLLSPPSLFLSNLRNAAFTSFIVLYASLNLLITVEVSGHIKYINSSNVTSPSPSMSPWVKTMSTSWSLKSYL